MRRPDAADEERDALLDDLLSDARDAGAAGEPLDALLDSYAADLVVIPDAVRAEALRRFEDGARECCPHPFCRWSGLPTHATDEHGTQWYKCSAGHEFYVGRGTR